MVHKVHFGLDDRVVVITGAAQGIGEACARRLVQDGAAVALWDVADDTGRRLAAELAATGARTLYCHCNVASKVEVDAALAATLAAFGRVDGLVNNAGIFKAAEFLDIAEADWDAVIAVNLKGSFLVGQAVAREMVRAGARRDRQHEFGQRHADDPDDRQLQREQGRDQPAHARDGAVASPTAACASTRSRRERSPPSWRRTRC